MPDWHKHVWTNLAAQRSDGENWQEVSAELAAHLEECYQACRNEGLAERPAVVKVLGQVADWQELRAELEQRREARRKQRRFRHEPAAYLKELEQRFLQLTLPP